MPDSREPLQLWLFDDPPVTRAEVARWTKNAVGLTPDNWRYQTYIEHWNVAGKIAQRKQERRAANDPGKPSPKRRRSDSGDPR